MLGLNYQSLRYHNYKLRYIKLLFHCWIHQKNRLSTPYLNILRITWGTIQFSILKQWFIIYVYFCPNTHVFHAIKVLAKYIPSNFCFKCGYGGCCIKALLPLHFRINHMSNHLITVHQIPLTNTYSYDKTFYWSILVVPRKSKHLTSSQSQSWRYKLLTS